jgi:hypothetical protein
MTSVDWDGLPLRNPYADRRRHAPRWIVPVVGWLPFVANLMPLLFYTVFVVIPWLPLYSRNAACYTAGACDAPNGPDYPSLPGAAVWIPLFWPLVAGALWAYFLLITGPVSLFVLGGVTAAGAGLALRAGRTACRAATVVAGVLVLALGVFQTTPMGAMFAGWLVD